MFCSLDKTQPGFRLLVLPLHHSTSHADLYSSTLALTFSRHSKKVQNLMNDFYVIDGMKIEDVYF